MLQMSMSCLMPAGCKAEEIAAQEIVLLEARGRGRVILGWLLLKAWWLS